MDGWINEWKALLTFWQITVLFQLLMQKHPPICLLLCRNMCHQFVLVCWNAVHWMGWSMVKQFTESEKCTEWAIAMSLWLWTNIYSELNYLLYTEQWAHFFPHDFFKRLQPSISPSAGNWRGKKYILNLFICQAVVCHPWHMIHCTVIYCRA